MTPAADKRRNSDSAHTNARLPEHWGIADDVAETEALRSVLQDASARTTRLLAALKAKRRQSRVVQQAMASLRELQLDSSLDG